MRCVYPGPKPERPPRRSGAPLTKTGAVLTRTCALLTKTGAVLKRTGPLLTKAAAFLMMIWGLMPLAAGAQIEALNAGPLFSDDAPLSLTIALDFDAVLRDRGEEREYQLATLYADSDGSNTTHGIGVKTRGYFRLHHLNCDIPPLRFNFKKGEVAGTIFEGQDKLKLVTHCQNRSGSYQQYVVQEYLLYRAYNLLTEASFLTRLVHITYRDTRSRHDSVQAYGFLIEDEDRMAERIGATLLPTHVKIHPAATRPDAMTLLSVFQYMIGNTDWTISTRHNIRVVFVDSSRTIVAVPYDFDWSGLISAPYAKPFPKLNIRSVRQRRFMGPCPAEPHVTQVLERVAAAETQILALFSDFGYLEDKYSERSVEYLEEFFSSLREPAKMRRYFAATCL